MNNAPHRKKRTDRIATRTQRTLLPLVAVGGSLAAMPASALELGDMAVQSRLGQPLRASVAYALAPNERLDSSCVSLGFGAPSSGVPGIGPATVSIADGTILLTGSRPIREPMVAARINVSCPYTANLSREYMLFIDPASPAFDRQTAAETLVNTPVPAAIEPRPAIEQPATATRKVSQAPIGKATRYLVQPGDSLSQIVARIENRPVGLWAAVNTVFETNPDAFIDSDPNQLKAGSWLTIPSFDGSEPVVAPDAVSQSIGTSNDAQSAGAATDAAPITTAPPVPTATTTPTAAAEATSVLPETVTDTSSDASLETEVIESDNPFVDGVATIIDTVVIPDTEIEGPVTSSTSPNVATAVINSNTPETSPSWLIWLAGSGLALIIGLLLFGRRFRSRPVDPAFEAVAERPPRPASDLESDGIEVIAHTGYTLEDDAPTAENVSLDADLVMGTGLDEGTDVDMEVAQDFGFAAPQEQSLDLELPFEPEPEVDPTDTGIFGVAADDATSILEKSTATIADETLSGDEYDMSVMLDATKMPQPEDITQRDLQAVEVDPVDEHAATGSFTGTETIVSEAELEILEQDYEDELTATQTANKEIERIAAEILANRAEAEAMNNDLDEETALLPAGDDEYLVETGIHDAATIEAATVEMPAAENDETADMEIDGGKVDTKAV